MSAVWSSFKWTANNTRRFDKPWQLMTGYGNIAKTKQDGSWVKYVFSLIPEKRKSSCAQPLEWPFELSFTEQIPKVLEDNSGHFWVFWKTLFGSERAKKSPEIYFRPKSFRTVFDKRTPIYFLAAPLLGLAKSIYFTEHNRTQSIGLCSIEFGSRTKSNGLSSIGFELFD